MSVKATSKTQDFDSLKMNTAKKVLKKYKVTGVRKNSPDEFCRLKKLVPTISSKENISQLDVVLEAISYIQSLQGNLETKYC